MSGLLDLLGFKKKKSRTERLLIHVLKRLDRIEEEINPKHTKTVDVFNKNREKIAKNKKKRVGQDKYEGKYVILKGENNNKLEKELLFELKKNKRELIKERILDAGSSNKHSPQEIKRIIVDKQQYCSKATFYRYLHELKKSKKLSIMNINNKEILYTVDGKK